MARVFFASEDGPPESGRLRGDLVEILDDGVDPGRQVVNGRGQVVGPFYVAAVSDRTATQLRASLERTRDVQEAEGEVWTERYIPRTQLVEAAREMFKANRLLTMTDATLRGMMAVR